MPNILLPLALSLGDPAGVGPELACAAWLARREAGLSPFFVVGSISVLAGAAQARGIEVALLAIDAPDAAVECFGDVLPVLDIAGLDYAPGAPSKAGAELALQSLEIATGLVRGGAAASQQASISGTVTDTQGVGIADLVVFLDADAARRPLAPPPGGAADALWPLSWALEMQAFGAQFLAQLGANSPPPASEFDWLPPALALSPAQLARFAQVFKAKLSSRIPTLGRAAFARALQDGWLDEPVAHQSASWQVFRLIGHADRLLLHIQSTLTPADTPPAKPGEAFGERTSAGVASAASRLLAAGRRAKAHPNEGQSPSKAELSVAASALTQAPDRPKRLPSR